MSWMQSASSSSEFLHALIAHGIAELLVLGEAGVDLGHGFVQAEGNEFVVAAVSDLEGVPVGAGSGLHVCVHDQFRHLMKLPIWPGLT